MAVRLSVSRAGRPLPPGRFLVLISVRGWVDPSVIMRLQGLGQLRNPITSSGIEPATFRLIAQCLNQLRYRMPHLTGMYHLNLRSARPVITFGLFPAVRWLVKEIIFSSILRNVQGYYKWFIRFQNAIYLKTNESFIVTLYMKAAEFKMHA
jgi:hypothetical protein